LGKIHKKIETIQCTLQAVASEVNQINKPMSKRT